MRLKAPVELKQIYLVGLQRKIELTLCIVFNVKNCFSSSNSYIINRSERSDTKE